MRQPFSSCVVILIYNKRVMELTCALLHPDARMVEKLQEWMKDMPFLRLCGCYTDTLEALRAYCVSRVDVYVVGIVPVSAGEVGGRWHGLLPYAVAAHSGDIHSRQRRLCG